MSADIEAQLNYFREQNRVSGFDIWLRVSSAGVSFMFLEPSTEKVRFISRVAPVNGPGEFRAALDAAIGAARRPAA